MASARCRFSFGVALHLEHREVDQRGHVLEVRVVDRLLERADGRVDVGVGLELVEGELRAGVVELRVVGEGLLEAPSRVLVVAAPLVREARVVGRLGKLAARLGRCGGLEGLRGVGADLVVPVVGLVVAVEQVQRGVELLLRSHVDVGCYAAGGACAAMARFRTARLFVPAAAAETGGGDDHPRSQNASDVLHDLALASRRYFFPFGAFFFSSLFVSWRTSIFSVDGPLSTGCHSCPPMMSGGGRSSRPPFESVGAPRSSSTTWYSVL
jgi:hypothetical protein